MRHFFLCGDNRSFGFILTTAIASVCVHSQCYHLEFETFQRVWVGHSVLIANFVIFLSFCLPNQIKHLGSMHHFIFSNQTDS